MQAQVAQEDNTQRLYEFEDPLAVRLVAIMSQLTSDIDSGKEKPDWTVQELLNYFKNNDIIIDKADLYDMVKNPPLNTKIANIKGDKVIFKGQESSEPGSEDDNQTE